MSYTTKLRRDAEEAYRFDILAYLLQAPWQGEGSRTKAPEVPDILKD